MDLGYQGSRGMLMHLAAHRMFQLDPPRHNGWKDGIYSMDIDDKRYSQNIINSSNISENLNFNSSLFTPN